MRGSTSSLIAQPPLPWRRGALALAGSLLLHLLIADLGFGGRPPQFSLPSAPLHAELAVMPLHADDAVLEKATVTALPVPWSRHALNSSPAQPERRDGAPSDTLQAGSGITDQRIYQARELDRYPQPQAPLSLPRPSGGGPLRLWLTIDARGHVVELVSASAGQPVEPALRSQLLTVVFSPALRDQQAVKSRILLELND